MLMDIGIALFDALPAGIRFFLLFLVLSYPMLCIERPAVLEYTENAVPEGTSRS